MIGNATTPEPLPADHAWVFCRECGNVILLHNSRPAFCTRQACGRVAIKMALRAQGVK
tara:strand:+ start:509 stop:682 length:174 start_codon:yes stop_codon:yes gene_type:complete